MVVVVMAVMVAMVMIPVVVMIVRIVGVVSVPWIVESVVGIAPSETPIVIIPSEAPVRPVCPCGIVIWIPHVGEHIGDVVWLYPYLVAYDNQVVEGRIIGRIKQSGAVIPGPVVAGRHLVRGRIKAPQTALVSALEVADNDLVVGVISVVVEYQYVSQFVGLCLCYHSFEPCLACFGFGFVDLRLALLRLCYCQAVMGSVHIVAIVRYLPLPGG